MNVYAGIDFKLREVSVAVLRVGTTTTLGTTTITCPKTVHYTQALNWIQFHILDAYREAARKAGIGQQYVVTKDMARLVVVEQPAGRGVRKLSMAEGVIIAKFADRAGVIDIDPASWRKAVLKLGRSLKSEEAKAESVKFIERMYGATLPHDEADAACLAHYGMENAE